MLQRHRLDKAILRNEKTKQHTKRMYERSVNQDRLVVKIKITSIFLAEKKHGILEIYICFDDGAEIEKACYLWLICANGVFPCYCWLFCCCFSCCCCFYSAHPDKMRWTTWSKNAHSYTEQQTILMQKAQREWWKKEKNQNKTKWIKMCKMINCFILIV